jgi:hypothetical protein
VSRQYAVGSKQAAAAATELNTLAGDLRASIAQFKTTDTTHRSSSEQRVDDVRHGRPEGAASKSGTELEQVNA